MDARQIEHGRRAAEDKLLANGRELGLLGANLCNQGWINKLPAESSVKAPV